jgi:hypothetical protein
LLDLMAEEQAAGINVFDDPTPPPAPGPPEVCPPIARFVPPPANWRQEEAERAARDAEAELAAGPPPASSLVSHPARPQRRTDP